MSARTVARLLELALFLILLGILADRAHGADEPRLAPRIAFYGALGAADLITTEIGLQRPGLVEGNPAMRDRGIRIGSKVAATIAVALIDRRLSRGTGRRARVTLWALRGLGVATWGGLAIHNARVSR